MSKEKTKWGIIGLGKIAHKMAEDLLLVEDADLVAVASRDINKSKEFASQYQVAHFYGSYEELVQNQDVDVVYIATPHVFHFENTMMCLKAGKSVLCEKAFGMNEEEVKKMIAEARKKELFLMEALWTRFIPSTEKILQLMEQETIGSIKYLRADFGFAANYDPNHRVFNKKLGGGSLLDIGIYPVYLSLLLWGAPQKIKANARINQDGIDSFCSMVFEYENQGQAFLESTLELDTPTEAYIFGEKGSIKVHGRFHHSEQLSIYTEKSTVESIQLPFKGNGYYHEIEEVNQCLLNGKIESDKMPHKMSLLLIQTLDKIRQQIGLNY